MNAFAPFADPDNAFQRGAFGVAASGGGGDPLANIWMAFRFQSHRLEPEFYYDVIEVTGANVTAVNGIYRLSITGTWTNEAGYYFVDQEANGQFWIKHDSVSPNQFYMQSTEGNIDPWDSSYVDIGGGFPVPLVYRTQEPKYKPTWMYQDAACTVPATEDGHPVRGVRDYRPPHAIIATAANPMHAMTLRIIHGVPVLEGNGVSSTLIGPGPEGATVYVTGAQFRNSSFSGFEGLIGTDYSGAAPSPTDSISRIMVGQDGTTSWYNAGSRTLRRNGVVGGPAPLQTWAVYSSQKGPSVWGANRIAIASEGNGGSRCRCWITSIYALMDPADREAVESYAATLLPPP